MKKKGQLLNEQHFTIREFCDSLLSSGKRWSEQLKGENGMETTEISTSVANGPITYADRNEQTVQIQWNEHPRFKGVSLKHLIRGQDTDGKLSCHQVRIDPNSVLDEHIHAIRLELHEVIEGEGRFVLGDKETAYYPGRMGVKS